MSADDESRRNVTNMDQGVYPGLWQIITSKPLIGPATQSEQLSVHALHQTWSSVSSIAEKAHDINMFMKDHEKMYRDSLYVILSVDWSQIQKIGKTTLITALENCAKKFKSKFPLAAERCRTLINIIKDPWENTLIEFLNSTKAHVGADNKPQPPSYPVINNQIVDYITSQPDEVLAARLAVLIERLGTPDLGLNLVRVCRRCQKGSNPIDKNLYFDYYVGLLYKYRLFDEFYSEILETLTYEDGLELVDRYSSGESSAPNLLKKKGLRNASRSILDHLLSKALQSETASNNTDDQLYKLAVKWISMHNEAWETPEADLQAMLDKYDKVAFSTLHIYLVCRAVLEKLGGQTNLKGVMLQLIIRRLNEGYNDVKKHIQEKDNMSQNPGPDIEVVLTELKQEVLKAEHRLADEFLLLAEFVRDSVAVHRECVLTAFSLRPTSEGLEALETVAPPEDTECAGLLGLTGEDIGCPSEVCDDLLIILNSARCWLLKWEIKWSELKNKCTEYMNDPDLFRYKKEELANAQVPVYCDYKVVHQDRMQRRIRLKEIEEEEMKKRQSEFNEPRNKKMRTLSSSDSENSVDMDIACRPTFMVSSGSEGDNSPDSKRGLTVHQRSSPPLKEPKLDNGMKPNKENIHHLLHHRHNGSPVKEQAPSLASRNMQPKVVIRGSNGNVTAAGGGGGGGGVHYFNVPGLDSTEFVRPSITDAIVLMMTVGQGVQPSQPNSTPSAGQPPPDPPPPPQPPANGPSANSSGTEQLPKFQQVFGKTYQQQQTQQTTPQQPSPAPVPQEQTPPPQPAPPQQVAAGATVVQGTRVVSNQASLLRSATPIQIPPSSLEALLQAHPQLASALAGREGKIMCFKQGSNIILTDKVRLDCQPGTSGIKRPVKRPPEAAAAPTPASSQLESQLREFDAVLQSVKERDGSGSSSSSSNSRAEVAATPPSVVVAPTPAAAPAPPASPAPAPAQTTSSNFSQPPPLTFNKTVAPAKPPAKKQTPPRAAAVASNSTSPSSSATTSPASSSSTPKTPAPSKAPPKASVEDEQTQKRIYEILSEYTEQLRNSPDLNNKPAPRRRSNPPTNPSPKRKKKPKEADEHVPSEDSSSNLAQDSEEHDSISESGSSLPAESPPAVQAVEPPPQPAPTVIAIPVATPSKPLVLQRQLMVVGKGAGQKLIRVIPTNHNLRALTSAPTLLLQQMCKPELINFQSVRSVKIPVMSSQPLSGVSAQQPVVLPFQSQMVKKESESTLIETLLEAAEMKQETLDPPKVEPCDEDDEVDAVTAQSACDSPAPAEVKIESPRATKVGTPTRPSNSPAPQQRALAEDKKRRLVRQDNIQKSLSEECEDLGVDAPSTSELFPDADLPFELSNNSDSSLSYLDTCQRRRNNGSTGGGAELNGRVPPVAAAAEVGDQEDSEGTDSPKRRKVCLTRPFAALKSRREDEAADTDGSVDGDDPAKAKRAVKPRSSCACCTPAAPKPTPAANSGAKKLNGKAGKKK